MRSRDFAEWLVLTAAALAIVASILSLVSERAEAPAAVTATPPPTLTPRPPVSPPPVSRRDPLPAPTAAADLLAGATVRVLRVEDWRVLQGAFPDRTYTMARLGWCEGGLDPAQAIMDVDGTMSYGTFMVKPQFWGEVGPTLEAQARQAARIAAEHPDLWPWSATRTGCPEWSR